MKRLGLLVRFSMAPNSLHYCGPRKAEKTFKTYLKTGRGEAKVKHQLKTFEGLYPYLRLIGKRNKMSPFDQKVAEAYWIGNSLLQKVSRLDLRKMVLREFPLPRSVAKELAYSIPSQAKPHHSFHVFYIQSVTGRVNLGLLTVQNNCRIGWGKVLRAGKSVTLSAPHVSAGPRLKLSQPKKLRIGNQAGIKASKGDILAFHWGEAVSVLTKRQAKNLEKYTKIGLSCVRRPTSS